YIYKQTSASVSDFQVTASMVVDGPISAIPSLDNQSNPGPYDFGPLLSFNFFGPAVSVSLGEFTAPNPDGGPFGGFPIWSMGGGDFHFIDALDAEQFSIGDGFVSENTDNSQGGSCFHTGACTGEGHWEALPEPGTIALFGIALAGLSLTARRRKKTYREIRDG